MTHGRVPSGPRTLRPHYTIPAKDREGVVVGLGEIETTGPNPTSSVSFRGDDSTSVTCSGEDRRTAVEDGGTMGGRGYPRGVSRENPYP